MAMTVIFTLREEGAWLEPQHIRLVLLRRRHVSKISVKALHFSSCFSLSNHYFKANLAMKINIFETVSSGFFFENFTIFLFALKKWWLLNEASS
jgi:hypothetical protein